MNWIISANSKTYNHAASFDHYGFIDWHMGKYKYNVGDNIYIYATRPDMKIKYKCIVKKKNLSVEECRDDSDYWIDKKHYKKHLEDKFMRLLLIEQIDSESLSLKKLLENGLFAAPQGPKKLSLNNKDKNSVLNNKRLINYIESRFSYVESNIYPELLDEKLTLTEGISLKVLVNRYERNSIARKKCIEEFGISCSVCGINFEEKYGEIGKDFIHIHHIVPLNTIGKEYKIDYKKDLIPVCPNCHAMLHRKRSGQYYSVNELKKILENN